MVSGLNGKIINIQTRYAKSEYRDVTVDKQGCYERVASIGNASFDLIIYLRSSLSNQRVITKRAIVQVMDIRKMYNAE